MFRDAAQAARACRVLLATVHRANLWTKDGPTDEAVRLLAQDGGPLLKNERVVLLVAFAFWDRRGSLRFAELLDALDVEPCDAVCSLLVAVKYGHRAVDQWLKDYEPQAPPEPPPLH